MDSQPAQSKLTLVVITVVLALILVAVGYYLFKNFNNLRTQFTSTKKTEPLIPAENKANESMVVAGFAKYEEVPVTVNLKVPDYKVDQGLANVVNQGEFELSTETKNMITKNGFAVEPGWEREFYTLYESNRYRYVPNFVSVDSVLHNYHLVFDFLLRRIEEDKLVDLLKNLNKEMLTASLEDYDKLKGTDWETAAKRMVGFFAVGSKLLDSSVAVPAVIKSEAEQEFSLIEAHQGISQSPLWSLGAGKDTSINTPQGTLPLDSLKEDYSQYIPRGHYTKSENLKAYFKSMMWYGRLTFRFKSEDEIKSALLTTLILDKDKIRKIWEDIYHPITFMVGKSDDITYFQMKEIVDKVYGKQVTLSAVQDKEKFGTFVKETEKLEPPQINSMPIFQSSIQPDREKEIKGFRFMGQRFTIDASIFQRLITREVGPKGESCVKAPFTDGRMLPKGLDIPAAMGSKEALSILKNQGELEYACYSENMSKMKDYLSGLKTDIWTQNLYWGWLYALLPLTTEKPQGYPAFMRNTAWMRKELNSFLGSWAELKHDTILYAKQVYAELGGGGPIEEKDDKGYVEPNPQVYARLASLLKMTKEGLSTRNLLSEANRDNLDKMEQLTLSLKTIAEKELSDTALTEDEYTLIRTYGGQLEHFWLEVNKEDIKAAGGDQRRYLDQNPAAVVADVATDPNGQVLEEGVGPIFEIWAVVPVGGKLKLVKGGVFSYYEFAWPLSDRLTDEKWRKMIDTNKTPDLPEWTNEFIVGIPQ